VRTTVCGSIPNYTCRICETTSVAYLEYVSVSKYLTVGKVLLAFAMSPDGDVVGVGSPGSNKKVNAASDRWKRSKDFRLYILDNPLGSSSSTSFDSDLSILTSSRSISFDSDLLVLIFLSAKKAFASRWSCSQVS
jgi:hypothetical protein